MAMLAIKASQTEGGRKRYILYFKDIPLCEFVHIGDPTPESLLLHAMVALEWCKAEDRFLCDIMLNGTSGSANTPRIRFPRR